MRRVSSKIKNNFYAAFINHCLGAIQAGYDKMRIDSKYKIDWEEDNLTICLVETIKQTPFLGRDQISVNYQTPIYNEAMAFGGANSLRAPRVDFKFSTFSGPTEVAYYAEAKNLSENDWRKADGASVDASHYRARYIDTGIENYLTERYPKGCLVAYIVNGNVATVVSGLNNLINRRNASPRIGLIQKDVTDHRDCCYISNNQISDVDFSLKHLMLQLA